MPRATIRRADGAVQFDTSCLSFQLIGKGTVNVQSRLGGNTNPGSVLIPQNGYNSTRVIATRSSFTIGRAGSTTVNNQFYLHYASSQSSGSVDYWVFELSSNLARSPGGLTLRNPDNGQIIYSSDYDMFKARDRISGVGQSKNLDSSKVWAAAQMDFAGHRIAPDSGVYYINGQAEIWDGGSRPNDTNWAYNNNGKVYGTRFNGSTVYTEEISWDDVRANLGNGSEPPPFPPDWSRPLGTVLLVDVTDL